MMFDLANWRKMMGWTRREAAEELKLTYRYYCQLEKDCTTKETNYHIELSCKYLYYMRGKQLD